MPHTEISHPFNRLFEIIKLLRSPNGCPWDREQTPRTLRQSLIEESYECIEAIDTDNRDNLREELGDLYLLVTMISYMNEQEKKFSVSDVLNEICEKLIRRHPHVFTDAKESSIPQILQNWDYIKEHVEGKKPDKSFLSTVSKSFPPLQRAFKLQKRAAKAGFDWKNPDPVFDKLVEETDELKDAIKSKNKSQIEEEIGDLLFTIVNLARHLDVDPAIALDYTNRKFIKRFHSIEEKLQKKGLLLQNASLEEMDALWEEAKNDSTLNKII